MVSKRLRPSDADSALSQSQKVAPCSSRRHANGDFIVAGFCCGRMIPQATTPGNEKTSSKTETEAFNNAHLLRFTCMQFRLIIRLPFIFSCVMYAPLFLKVYAPLFLKEAASAQPKVLLIIPLAQPCSSSCFLLYCSSLALVHDGL